jgi:hypothetical protein
MPEPTIHKVTAWEDASVTLLARVSGNSGAYITQASLTGISTKVFDGETQQGTTITETVSSVVFDTLQTDTNLWDVDTTGFNFKTTVAASYFPSGGKVYRVEVVFDPSSGDDFPAVFDVTTKNLMGS